MKPETQKYIAERQELCAKLKQLLIERLDLAVDSEWLTDDQPLFGRGLELDSVDALELAVGVEYELDVTVDDEEVGVLGSINALADYIQRHSITV